MKKKDPIDALPEFGGSLHKEPLGLSEMDKYQLEAYRNAPGRSFFNEGFNRSHPSESLATSAFAAWRNFDAIP